MILAASLPGCGAHPAAWRCTTAPRAPSLPWFRALATTAERAGLDAVLFGMVPWGSALGALTGGFAPDPLPLIVALATATRHVGLAAALPATHAEPFNIARSFAAADRLTAGRAAWIAAPAARAETAGDLARAAECIEVVRALWDSWEDEALVFDKPGGWFSNPARVHRIDHAGPAFSVRGPLNAPRPPQGHVPVLQCDTSADGLALARATADLFVAPTADPAALRPIRQTLGPAGPRILATFVPLLAPTRDEAAAQAATLDAALDPAVVAALLAGHPDAAPWTCVGTPHIGTAETLADAMEALLAAGACDGFVLAPGVLPAGLDAVADLLVPVLRARGLRPGGYAGATLRGHLGLPRPANRFAA